jgi:hypothetical protein
MDNNFSESNFPSSFEPQEEKRGKKYILKYAKDLWGAAKKSSSSYAFNTRKDRYINNRKYSEGLQSIEKFKQQFSVTGDNTYLNFDWAVSTPLPKLVEVFRGQMLNQPYKIQFTPVDSLSITEYDTEKKVKLAEMEIQKQLAPLVEQGVIEKKTDLPEDNDELEIYMQTNFKLAQSIAMETITKAVLEDNDMDYINDKIAKDLIDLKICAVRVCLDENKNIKIEYIDPVDLVTSYVKRADFQDVKHVGVMSEVTIDDLRVMSAGQLTEEELFEIAKSVAGRYGNGSWDTVNRRYYDNFDWDRVNTFKVMVLDFEFFSTDDMTVTSVKARNNGFKTLINEEPRNKLAERRTKVKKVKNVYMGKYVVGTDYIFDYGLKENIIRERINGKYSTNTTLGFVVYAPDIYDMENKSKVEEMIPYADELIRIQLKMQQIIAKAAPSGYAMNVDAIVEGLQGMGIGGMKPIDARAMRDQIGDIYYRAVREDGTPITPGQPPITALPNGLDNSIMLLINAYNAALIRMKESIGVNDAIDSSQPDNKALIGIQKLAVAAHKTALKSLYSTFLRVNEDVARQVSMLAQQLIRKNINNTFINMVGKETVDQLDVTKLTTSDFSIVVQMLPDAEEMSYLENKIELAIQSQPPMINLQDAFAIRRVMKEDVDKAEQLLAVREKRRRKENMQRSEQMQQQNAQLQAQVAQAAEQARMQTEQTKAQLEAQNTQLEYDLRLRNDQTMEDEKRKTIALELDVKKELIREAAQAEGDAEKESGDTAYDRISIPKVAGTRMPGVTPDIGGLTR